jgi:hypothetical protein
MSYEQFGKIAADDYVGLVTALNKVWGVGTGNYGMGQPELPIVATNSTVTATEWSNLYFRMVAAMIYQADNIPSLDFPAVGKRINYDAKIPTGLATIQTNRGSARSQGTSTQYVATSESTWTFSSIATFTIQFESPDKARYFFNMGGQISVQFAHPPGQNVDQLIGRLTNSAGTVVISQGADAYTTYQINGLPYKGVTKLYGGGLAAVYEAYGYYGLSATPTEIFRQRNLSTITPSRYDAYNDSYIKITAQTNGTQGAHGDNGDRITIAAAIVQVPSGLRVQAGTTTSLFIKEPEISGDPYYGVAKTWGTITVTNTVENFS